MSLPRYSRYTSTQDPWISEVPSHWSLSTLGKLGTFLKGRGGSKQDASDAGVPCIRYGELYTKFAYTIREPVGFVSEDVSSNYLPVQRGDILFAASGEDMADIGRSASLLSDQRTVAGGDLVVLRPTVAHDPAFLGYASDCSVVKAQKAAAGRGTTVKHIYPDELRRVVLALPPVPEQRAISAFLARETAKIDKLVAEQERLIALLHEQRQAVISHALTKGLDAKVPMKDSGVEWVGTIPTHWNTVSIGLLLKEHPRYGVLVPDSVDVGVPMLRITDIEGDQADREGLAVISEVLSDQYSRTLVSTGDVVLSVVGTLGKALVVREELAGVNLSRALARLVPGPDIDAEFLRLHLTSNSFSHFIDLVCTGSAQKVLNMDDLRSHRMPLPPISEQRLIASAASSRSHGILELVSEASRALSLLRERRTALITAAVTGQIDVRGLVETAA